MMATKRINNPIDAADLEELLDAEIPCGGHHGIGPCGRSAVLHSRGHGHPERPEHFKCMDCWMVWYRIESGKIKRRGHVRCRECNRCFYDLDSFSHYRPI